MQKKIAFYIVIGTILITLITAFLVVLSPKKSNSQSPFEEPEPSAYNIKHHESENMIQSRDAYIAFIHRSAPGTQWQKINHETIMQKMQLRSSQSSSYKIHADEYDTLANGFAIGNWSEVGSFNTAGRIRATEIDFSTNTIYAFSDGGNLWKGDIDGANWAITNDNFKLTETNFLRKVGSKLIVCSGEWNIQGVYYSEDEGVSWTETSGMENVETYGFVFDCVMLNNAEHTIYALAYNWDYVAWNGLISLYKSDDLGVSFTEITSWDEPTFGGSGNFNLWSSRDGSDTAYLIENNHFQYLDETGMPQLIGTIPLAMSGDEVLCGYENGADKRFYAAVYNWGEGSSRIYASFDGGITWNQTGAVSEYMFSNRSFHCAKKTPDQLMIGGVDTYVSDDAGEDWQIVNNWYDYYDDIEIYLHADIPFIDSYIDPVSEDEITLISTDGGLFSSDDFANQVKNITMQGMRNAQYYDVYTYREDPLIIYAGAQDQGYQRTQTILDEQYYFDQLISGDYGHFASTDGGENVWMIYPGFITYIKNAPTSSGMTFGDFEGTGYLWMPPLMNDPVENEICWWAGGKYLYKVEKLISSLDYEMQAFNFSDGDPSAVISALAYSTVDSTNWYVMNSIGDFFYSTNSGESWTKSASFDGPDAHYFYGNAILPSRSTEGVIYVAGSGYDNPGVYKSTDNGLSFSPMNTGLPSTLVYDLAALPNDSLIFAATDVGPYVYVSAENKWYDLAGDDAPYQTYWSVDYVDEIHTARFGTYGRGIFDFKLYYEEPPVSIEQNQNTKNMFSLFPNPVNDFVQIKSEVFLNSAEIKISDMKGNIVYSKSSVTINKQVPYKIDIHALPAGTYLVNILSGNNKWTNKLIVNN